MRNVGALLLCGLLLPLPISAESNRAPVRQSTTSQTMISYCTCNTDMKEYVVSGCGGESAHQCRYDHCELQLDDGRRLIAPCVWQSIKIGGRPSEQEKEHLLGF